MTEELAIDSFEHFADDLDDKTRKKFRNFDYNAYYYIITRKEYWNRRGMAYKMADVYKYSFSELYDKMCDLFYWFDGGDTSKMYDIILLKNFINYKMSVKECIT